MRWNLLDKMAVFIFIAFTALYFFIATIVCNDLTKNTFDVIQGVSVFDVDDTYRLFLAQSPFLTTGLWLWNFILPANLLFDGFFSWVTSHDVYLMRCSHIVAVLSSLLLVYRAGRHLGVSALWMLLSCSLLLLMPLYIFLSMSFYGESLLAAAMGVLLYFIAVKKEAAQVAITALLPFIRPEGFFFLIAMVVRRFMQKKYLSAMLILAPGFVYFCFIMYAFELSADAYFAWRNALSAHYSLGALSDSVMGHASMPYYTINPLWWIAGAAGAFLPVMRHFRGLFIASVMIMLYWATQALNMEARGEARYFFAIFPLWVLSIAAAADAVCKFFSGRKWVTLSACSLFFFFVVVENFAQIDPVRSEFFADRRWPLAGEAGAKPYFGVMSPEIIQWRRTTADFLVAYSRHDNSISKIIVHAYPVFYDLRQDEFPGYVDIEYSPMMPKVTHKYYGGSFYAMYPRMPQYSFYQFSPVTSLPQGDGGKYALYVGPLYNGVHSPLYANPVFQVYKVRYNSTQSFPLGRFFPES
jgi:hypothetical protein